MKKRPRPRAGKKSALTKVDERPVRGTASKGSEKEVDVTPDASLFWDIGRTSLKVHDAIAELVANSFDARVGTDPITVDITLTPQHIMVVDDASGMSEDALTRAITLAKKDGKGQVGEGSKKGLFGLGLKAAGASLGNHWEVRTRPEGSKEDLSVTFDRDEWEKAAKAGKKWKAMIRTDDNDHSGPLKKKKRGTAVIIRKLNDNDPHKAEVSEWLGKAFKPHLARGDVIRVNGEVPIGQEFTLLGDKRKVIDIDCLNGKITGWVGLDVQTHNDEAFGINLYREDQLHVIWDKSFFKPHLMTSRIVGELDLDFVPTNYYKKGFETQSKEWKEATKKMKEALKPVVAASRFASKGKDTPERTRQALVLMMGGEIEQKPKEADNGEPEGELDIDVEKDEITVDGRTVRISGTEYRISGSRKDLEDREMPWSYIVKGDKIETMVNTGSAIYAATNDHDVLDLLAMAECLLEFLVKDRAVPVGEAVRARNELMVGEIASGDRSMRKSNVKRRR